MTNKSSSTEELLMWPYKQIDDQDILSSSTHKSKKKNLSICSCCCGFLSALTTSLVVAFSIFVLYLILGVFAFSKVFKSNHKLNECANSVTANNTPSHWKQGEYSHCPELRKLITGNNTFDGLTVPENSWKLVEFKSRKASFASTMKLSAFLITQNDPLNHSFVIVIHGYHGCKSSSSKLATAGMLYYSGYNVLIPDLRNHGSSQVDSKYPYATFGYAEHLDVLGGYDYLVEKFGANITVGLHGSSMGAATGVIAYAQEEKLKAAFLDSPPADVYQTILFGMQEIVNSRLLSTILMSGAHVVSKVMSKYGFPPFPYDPLKSCSQIGNRPLFLVQGYKDMVVPESNTISCLLANRGAGGSPSVYFGDNKVYTNIKRGGCNNHCTLIASQMQEYKQKLSSFFGQYLQVPIK